MISNFVVYDPLSGRIKQSVQCSIETMLCAPNEDFITTDFIQDIDGYYVSNGTLIKRPLLEIHLNGFTLNGVPKGAVITIENATYKADGTAIKLKFDLPGEYQVKISHWPYQDWECSVGN